jgi:hypothetical protein
MKKEKLEDYKKIIEKLEQKKKTAPMSWQNTIILIVFLIGLFALLLAFMLPPVSFGAKCDIKGIEYKNVCPAKCWNDEISCRFCPLPSDLSCDINAKAPILKLIEMFR